MHTPRVTMGVWLFIFAAFIERRDSTKRRVWVSNDQMNFIWKTEEEEDGRNASSCVYSECHCCHIGTMDTLGIDQRGRRGLVRP